MRPLYDPAPILASFDGVPDRDIADRLGVTSRTVQRWRHGGRINTHRADHIAIELDSHPILIWPEWETAA